MIPLPVWHELVPTLLLLSVGVLALCGGYWQGKDAWYERHAIRVGSGGSERTFCGLYAELAVFAMAAVAFGIAMVFCPDVDLYHAGGPEFALVILWFGCVYLGVYRYSRRKIQVGPNDRKAGATGNGDQTDKKTDPSSDTARQELRNGYRIYNIYSCVLFGLGGLALAKVALQFRHDWAGNAAASRRLVQQAEALVTIRPAIFDLDAIVEVERAYLSFRELLGEVLVQVEPIAFLFLYVMAMALVITMTPIRAAYLDGARRLSSMVSVIAVVVLLAISLASYFLHATVASRELVDSLSHMKDWPTTEYRHYIRYSEIYREVKAAGGFSGFIRALLSEAVFLVIVVGVAQQAASAVRGLMGRTRH